MRWVNYETEADRKAMRGGVQVTGDLWSDAPGPGNQWVIPAGFRKPVIVTTRAASHGGKPFSVGPHSAVRAPADVP